ncbi:hypothetical protein CDD82_5487 [Ophiocordyceps australis]|uniref:Protein kinase domain-containing protein n=1 Tax=Ophiocordyceps australis TaxID=1399860 RepID=A0A2C5Z0N0_9HYPO|nr:hypothetical protein CDD82_5487 [Ophiocordyceps australis]
MEIAAAALQFTSMAIQAFHGCVLAIEFFRTAQHMGADGDLFRAGLEFEKYRLMAWAKRGGLLGDNEKQTLNWQLATILLQQLQSFLTSANQLRNRYDLDVTEEEVQATEEAQAAEASKHGVAKLIARLKPNLRTTAGKIIQENNSTIKRIRWAALDRKKLKAFLGEIAGLINKLEYLLDSTERQQERNDYDNLLRQVISLTTTAAEAGQVKELLEDGPYQRKTEKSINAAAYLKQVRLVLGADRRADEVTPSQSTDTFGPRMPRLSILGRSLKPWNKEALYSSGLEFATYRDRQVLIQWKLVESTQWEIYTKQIKSLAVFLMSLSDKSFRSLPCLGYYPLETKGRHGIVYSMPDEKKDWEFKTLKSLISAQPLVSLRRRLEIARALADTVLQLHTAGWLHKSIRSDNIIFLSLRDSPDNIFLQSEPYVIGYEYARSDTEDSAKVFSQLPDTQLETDLYRHPQARGLHREAFQKRFDMYALACIIIELVTWQPLVDVFSSHVNENLKEIISIAQESNNVTKLPSLRDLFENEEAVAAFRYKAGDKVLEVIKTCFSAEKAKEGEEGLLTDQTAVVEGLEWCRV